MELTQSLAYRISVRNSFLTLTSLATLSFLFYIFYIQGLDSRLENDLLARHTISEKYHSHSKVSEQEAITEFQGKQPAQYGIAYELIGKNGEHIGGNVQGLTCEPGFTDAYINLLTTWAPSEIISDDLKDSTDTEHFRFLIKSRNEGCTAFGKSLYKQESLLQSMQAMALWAIPLCLLPAILFSVTAARRVSKRLRTVSKTIREVVQGDLQKRLEVTGNDEIDQLSKDVNRSFDRLQDSVQSLQDLASTAAHDLRVPLSRLAIPLEAAIDANASGQIALDELHEVHSGLQDIYATFDAILRITQIESGHRRAGLKPLDLSELITNIAEIYRPVCEDEDFTLKVELDTTSIPLINGDTELLQQMLVNLIENSLRYCPKGTELRIRLTSIDDSLRLVVTDNGAGIPAEEHDRVFRRFYRVNKLNEDQKGTGLGLSLVRAVVELHNATVQLSDAKPGLCVTLNFPASTSSNS